MTGILLTLALLILLTACLYLVVARPDLVAGWLNRLLGPRRWLRIDPYPPEAAEAPYDPEPVCGRLDPIDEHFGSIYVESDHPRDCTQACCWEIRLNELVDQYDWHAAEYEMRKTK